MDIDHKPNTVAIIAARNEALYLRSCIRRLRDQGIKVAIIDNDSTDETREICLELGNDAVIHYETYPYNGYYNWEGLLNRKAELRRILNADWIIHHDADEVLQSNRPGETLLEAIARIDSLGYDAINFDEFVFIPENNTSDYRSKDFYSEMKYYYYFAPGKVRLIRAFKNSLECDNVKSGGHILPLNQICLFPENLVMRHYICLSMDQAKRKYLNRSYSEEELKRGWHRNRVSIKEEQLNAPTLSRLFKISENVEEKLSTMRPESKHFWEW